MNVVWKFLEDNQLTIDTSNVSQLLKCGLCSHVMEHPKVTTCGCTFCNKCIKDYLEEDTKHCPGCIKDNAFSELSYANNLTDCKKSDKEILKSTVKCPQNGCDVNCELRYLLEHMKSCTMRHESCILKIMGCTSTKMNSERMEKHLREELKVHFQLVADNLSVVRNWMNSLQTEHTASDQLCNEVAQLRTDNAEMRLRQNDMSVKLQSAVSELGILRTDNSQKREMIEKDRNRVIVLENEILQITSGNKLRDDEIRNLTEEMGKMKRDNATLKMHQTQMKQENQTEFGSLRRENAEMSATVDRLGVVNEDKKKIVDSRETETKSLIEELTQGITKLKQENESRKKEVNDIKDDIKKKCADKLDKGGDIGAGKDAVGAEGLHWTPTRLGQHQDQCRYSKIFSVREYKMRVRMVWSKSNNIYTNLCIVRSTDDARAAWPMKLRLCMRLADPDSANEIRSKIIDCHCDIPEEDEEFIDGSQIYNVSLAGHDGVKRTDSIVISVQLA